jgi:hypothetical protein
MSGVLKRQFQGSLCYTTTVRGLQDPSTQEKVMTAAAEMDSGELTLKHVVRLVEAAEMAKSVQASVSAKGSLAGLSDHRREKEGKRLEHWAKSSSGGKKTCDHCGQSGHGSGLQERRDAPCPAFSVKCHDCNDMSHYARFCKTVKGKAKSSSRGSKTQSRGRGGKVATIKESGGVQGDGVVPVSGDLGSISGSQMPLPEGDFFSLSSTLCSDEASEG